MNPSDGSNRPSPSSSASPDGVVFRALEAARSLDIESVQNTGAMASDEPTVDPYLMAKQQARTRSRLIRFGTLAAVILIGIGAMLFMQAHGKKPATDGTADASQKYANTTIPLEQLNSAAGLSVQNNQTLSVNGQLNANNGLVLAPANKPTTAVAGELYYDQTTNKLSYYNGTQFVNVASSGDLPVVPTSVASLGGATGAVGVGGGLSVAGNTLANTGVLTLQGQSGNVSLLAGSGIAISGTTLSSSGVLSVGGQNGDITLGNGLGLSGNQLKNTGIISAVGAGTITVTNDGNGNITIDGPNGGGGGTVSSPGGTIGKIAKFTGVQTVADSLLSDNGTTVTVGGALHVTGTVTLDTALSVTSGGTGSNTAAGARSNLGAAASGANSDITSLSGLTTALTVAQGGTGIGTLATNGVLLGNGTSPLTAVVAGSAGQCLVSTAGAPTWQACPGSSGVSSLNGLNGAITLQGSSAGSITNGVGTITINDASTTTKGLASFNSNDFTVTSGAVDTIQGISTSASPTFAGLTISGALSVNTLTPSAAAIFGVTGQNLTLQGATTKLTSTSGANTSTLTFVAPTATVTYRLQTAAAGTYDICTTAANCVGVGGGVTTSGGTTNKLAKFTGAQTIGDSIISDNGTTATITGNLSVTGSLTLGTALSVGNGGTGTTSLTLNGIVLGNGSSTLGTVTAASSGLCLVSTAGAPTFQACPGSGGVTSVNGLSGVISIANASGSGSTITINDATTGAKGIASFNGTNFSVTSGAVNTIQGISTGSAPQFAGLTLSSPLAVTSGGTGVSSTPTSGQLLIGNASSGFSLNTLTAGAGVTITNGNGTVTIAAPSSGSCAGCANTALSNLSSVAINTSLLPGVAGGPNLGSGVLPFGQLYLAGTSASPASNNFLITGSATAARTITLPDASGTVAVSASGNIALSGSGNITFTGQLPVSNGGTGTNSLTANGVLVGNGSSAISSVAASGANQCLIGNVGSAPTWGVCPGAGGVSSVNTLTGALTIQGTGAGSVSSAGTTITLNDASTSTKGLASFNSTNFSVSSGAVNTIQDINTTAAPQFGQLTLTSSQATNPMLVVNNTNAAGTGNLLDLKLNNSSKFSVAPSGNVTSAGTINGQTISSTANFTGSVAVGTTLSVNTITPTGAFTIGATGQQFTLQGNNSSTLVASNGTNTTTVGFQNPTANVTYTFATAAAGSYTICTTVGNCAGVGGGVTTPGGTANTIAKFTGSGSIGNSIITDNGSTVTIGGTLAVNTLTPTAALTVGATGQNLTLQGATVNLSATAAGITNSLTFAAPSGINKTITIPNATGTVAVTASGPLSLDSAGNLTCPTCLTSGGGGGTSGVASVNTLTGALTLQGGNAGSITSGGTTITIADATAAIKGLAEFNSTNLTVTSGSVNTIQDINTSATPQFAGLKLSGDLVTVAAGGANIGSAAKPFGQLYLAGTSASPASNNFLITGAATAARTITLPDASGTVAVSASGNIALDSAGNITFTGQLPVANGGTGSNTAAGARSNLGAAASGANSDITSLTGLTTALQASEGGTGQSSYTVGDLLFASGATTLSKLTDVATGSCLVSGGVGVAPSWGSCAGGAVTGSGTANTIALFTATGSVIGNSILTQTGVASININGNLLPNANNTRTIGSAALTFQSGYYGSHVYTPDLDVASAGTLTIGTVNASTVSIATNDAAHTINIANGGSSTVQTVNIGSANSASGVTISSGTGKISLLTNGGASSTTGTLVQSVTNNSTKTFQVQNASSQALFNVDTTNSQISITNYGSTSSTLGTAVVDTAGGVIDFPTWGGTGWTLAPNSATDTAGTGPVSSTWQSTPGQVYSVSMSYTTTGCTTMTIQIGGQNLAAGCSGSYSGIVTAFNAGVLTIIPNVGFTGTLSNLLIKPVNVTNPVININNSDGTTAFQIRTTGTYASAGNIFLGLNSGQSNQTGTKNTAVGALALQGNTTGSQNVALGYQALYANTTGSINVAIGYQTLLNNTTGSTNVAIGNGALALNSTGNNNIAIGSNALARDSNGSNNIAIGFNALAFNTTGTNNTAFGTSALWFNTTGLQNTALGYGTLQFNTTGNSNTATGMFALLNSTTGSSNTANGLAALGNNSTGSNNTATGSGALNTSTTGSGNTGNGQGALAGNTTGNYNTGSGQSALFANTTGIGNVGFGQAAGGSNTTGSYNSALGYQAGYFDVNNNFATLAALQNSSAIGAYAQVQKNNTIVLGSVDNVTQVVVGATVPIGTNAFGVTPVDLNSNTITASQSNGSGTITASGSIFSSSNVGEELVWADGTTETITGFTSATQITGSSTTITETTQYFRTHHIGLQVKNTGDTYVAGGSTTAFQVQNASSQAVFTTDTTNNQIILGQSSALTGKLTFATSAGANTISIVAPASNPSGNYTVTFGALTGNDTFCTVSLNNCTGSGATSVGALNGGTANANGATISAGTLYLQSASASFAGLIDTTNGQTFAGNKTFNGSITTGTSLTTPSVLSTGNLSIQAAGTNTLSLDTAGAGTITIGNSNATTLTIANNAVAHTINVATGAANQAVTIGSTSGSSAVTLQGGTGGVNLSTNGGVSGTTGTVVKSVTNNSTKTFQVQNASSQALFTVDTTNSQIDIVNYGSTSSTLGSAVVDTAGGLNDFPTWSGTGWTTAANSATHTSGTTNLSSTWQPIAGQAYAVSLSYTTTGCPYLLVTLGNQTITLDCSGSYSGIVTATTTAFLNIIPNGSFTGTISNFLIKPVNVTNPVININNSDGTTALQIRTNGNYSSAGNTFIGLDSGQSNQTSGTKNTAVGAFALQGDTTGAQNVAMGYQALYDNTTGSWNTALGYQALLSNISGTGNVALGNQALSLNTTGNENIAIGDGALAADSTGSQQVAIGQLALHSNTTGVQNTAIGAGALQQNTTGGGNTATGSNALTLNTTGGQNTANGDGSLQANTTGSQNTATGFLSLANNTTGNFNSGNSYSALFHNTTGSQNTATGANALFNNTTGSYNTAVGQGSLLNNTIGSYNSVLGFSAGYADVNNNFLTSAAIQNAAAIGAYAQVQANNTIAIGSVDNYTQVVIGATVPVSTNAFGVTPVDLNSASITASQSNGSGTITASGSIFSSANVGEEFVWADGTTETITAFTDATHVTGSSTILTETASYFRTHHIGLQVKNNGDTYVAGSSTTTFQVQNASSQALFTADTTNSQVILGKASTLSGKLTFATSAGANTISIVAPASNPSGNYTVSFGALTGNDTFCTVTLNNCLGTSATSVGALNGGTANANGATLASNVLYLQSASNSFAGLVDTTNGQIFAGNKQFNGTITLGASAGNSGLINNGSTVNTTLALGNFATGGSIGSAASTVDIYTSISVAQTTASQSLTIQSPTAGTAYGRTIYVANVGTTSFTFTNTYLTTVLNPGATATLVWENVNGTANWTYAGADGSAIQNQSSTTQTANFNISGTGTIGTSLTTPLVQSSGNLSIQANGTNTLALDTTGAGTITIGNANATTLNIANNAVAHTINFATGAANQAITIGSTSGSSAVTLQGGTGNINLFNTSGGASGTLVQSKTSNSTAAFMVQNASTQAIFTVDTTNTRIAIGDGTNTSFISATSISGPAFQHTKYLTLPAEYVGGALDASSDSSCSSSNNGLMTSGYSGDASPRQNYYQWVSNSGTQCYDVVVQVPIPADFSSWTAAPKLYLSNTGSSSTSVCMLVLASASTGDSNYGGGTPAYQCATGVTSTLAQNTTFPSLGSTYLPSSPTNGNTYMTIKLRMTSTSTSDLTKIGTLILQYQSTY